MAELNQERTRVSPLRSFTAGAIGMASVVAPVVAGVEAFADTSNLDKQAQEGQQAASYLELKYGRIVRGYEKDLEIEQDERSGRLSVTLTKDPKLSVEPIEEALDALDDISKDASRLKWLTIGSAVGLISAAAIGRWDRSMGKGGSLRETYLDMSDEFCGCFVGMMVFAGIPTALLFSTQGTLQRDIGKIKAFDVDRAGEISDSMQADLQKLDIRIKQTETSIEVSFNPDPEVLEQMGVKSGELASMMPNISDQEMAQDQFTLLAAALALTGTAGSAGTLASSIGRLKRGEKRTPRISAEQRAVAYLETHGRESRTAPVSPRDYHRVRR